MRALITLILNVIWLVTAGWALVLGYLVAGALACLAAVGVVVASRAAGDG